jgi:hypothetical protein
MTATQTMEVVYGLFKSMKVVMDGMDTFAWHFSQRAECFSFLRWKGIGG